ncbi:MAG: UDP-3-O-(3-hydroxymyristoyl)glucosamine N-acyltransferase [Bacteroidales bacterium]|jgi:UDP-3-O-[3-hydroxymyristoyl] glucosamine N-acyltransferase|nr:UDP-3-O-(3-hydroxymyristoyl)glucosamine N-acyltransferase [Bacteroidales bacterium]
MFKALDIAPIINGKIIGDPEVRINGFSKIEESTPGTLSFLSSDKYSQYLENAKASIIVISKNLVPEKPVNNTLIVVDDAYKSVIELMNIYNQNIEKEYAGISENAHVEPGTIIAENCYIGDCTIVTSGCEIGSNTKIYAQVYLGKNVTIGSNTKIYPGVKIYANCRIGNNCIINAGTIIGADGFGFIQENGKNIKVPHLGNVVIENDVEIGANCTIDKATLGSTIIRQGVKMDNLIHVAHNVEIGKNTVIASQAGIAGSTKIGDNCMIGGQVGIIDHIVIGNNVKIIAQSGVITKIKDNETFMGTPAFNSFDYKRSYSYFRKLPEKFKQLEDDAKNNK